MTRQGKITMLISVLAMIISLVTLSLNLFVK